MTQMIVIGLIILTILLLVSIWVVYRLLSRSMTHQCQQQFATWTEVYTKKIRVNPVDAVNSEESKAQVQVAKSLSSHASPSENVYGWGDCSFGGTGSFKSGLYVNEVTGLSGQSVNMISPLVLNGGFQLATHVIVTSTYQIQTSGLYRFTNTHTNAATTVTLPPASQLHGGYIVVVNETNQPFIQINTIDSSNDNINMSVTTVRIPVWGQLWSNGDRSWLCHYIE